MNLIVLRSFSKHISVLRFLMKGNGNITHKQEKKINKGKMFVKVRILEVLIQEEQIQGTPIQEAQEAQGQI